MALLLESYERKKRPLRMRRDENDCDCTRGKPRDDIQHAVVGPVERSRHDTGCGFLSREASTNRTSDLGDTLHRL
jgi:hypothetical protein